MNKILLSIFLSLLISSSYCQINNPCAETKLKAHSKPIKKSSLTVEKLVSAILFAQQTNIIANADKLGQELRKENGVTYAVKIINDYITAYKNGSSNK